MKTDSSHLTTTREVIEALGGTAAVAKLTHRSYPAAWNWNKKAAFPEDTVLDINDALAEKGLSADPSLWPKATRNLVSKKCREIFAGEKNSNNHAEHGNR